MKLSKETLDAVAKNAAENLVDDIERHTGYEFSDEQYESIADELECELQDVVSEALAGA